ncbi:porin [Kaustia mangrovi]|uniref:Porin n=1 Tax=Kaustia mangrovi TaxID=2593653 RepID=A0A7S8C1T9_9HYPH|nr:porin [Kaustia mangrovi]QPC41801.1 porin [Kaustia mangrovi]
MSNTKWLRRALLGGVAVSVMATGAQADELDALKAQLEALQARVNQLEAQPAANSQLPEGASFITFTRGTEATADWNTSRVGDAVPSDRGFTIAITPTADLPAPVHEVTVSGYVKGDVIYDFNQDLGNAFSFTAITDDPDSAEHIRLHAEQSRFRIKSRSDTSIGQIRTLIEGDFWGGDFRLRHAWGEWDMTPNLTLGVGRYWRNFMSLITGISTVDFNGPIGLIGTSRNNQVRLTYHDGPMEFAVSIEDPTGDSSQGIGNDLLTSAIVAGTEGSSITTSFAFANASDNLPDLNARFQYSAPGGWEFLVSGMLRNFHTDGDVGFGDSDSALGWAVQGAVNFNLGDIATLTTSIMYGDGIGNYLYGSSYGAYVDLDGDIKTIEGLGVFAGLSFDVTEATTFNVGWGWAKMDSGDTRDAADLYGVEMNREIMSVHANIMWQPVREMRLGWEVIWADRKYRDGGHLIVEDDDIVGQASGSNEHGDAWRAQFGAWFFF